MARGGAIRKGLTIGLAAGVGAALVRAARARRSASTAGAPPTWPPMPTALVDEPPATGARPAGPPAAVAPMVEAALAAEGTEALVAEAAVLEAAGVTEAAEVDEEAAAAFRAAALQTGARVDEGGADAALTEPAGDDAVGIEAVLLAEEAALEAERLEAERMELTRLTEARSRAEEEDAAGHDLEQQRRHALARFAAQKEEAQQLLSLQEEREAKAAPGVEGSALRRPLMAADLDVAEVVPSGDAVVTSVEVTDDIDDDVDDLDDLADTDRVAAVADPMWPLEVARGIEPAARLVEEDALAAPTLDPVVPDEAVADLEEEPAWGVAVGTEPDWVDDDEAGGDWADTDESVALAPVASAEPTERPGGSLEDLLDFTRPADAREDAFEDELPETDALDDDALDDELLEVDALEDDALGGDTIDDEPQEMDALDDDLSEEAVDDDGLEVGAPSSRFEDDVIDDDALDDGTIEAAAPEDDALELEVVEDEASLDESMPGEPVADEAVDEERVEVGGGDHDVREAVGQPAAEPEAGRAPGETWAAWAAANPASWADWSDEDDDEAEPEAAPVLPATEAALDDVDEPEELEAAEPVASAVEEPEPEPEPEPALAAVDEDEGSPAPDAAPPRRRPLMTGDFDDVLTEDSSDDDALDDLPVPAPVRRTGRPRVPLKARRDPSSAEPASAAATPPAQAPRTKKAAAVKKAVPAPKKAVPTKAVKKTVTAKPTTSKAAASKASKPATARVKAPKSTAAKITAAKITADKIGAAKPATGRAAVGKATGTKKATSSTKRAPASDKATRPAPPVQKIGTRKKAPSRRAADVVWVEPVGSTCPPSHPVKAVVSRGIFHVVGGLFYERSQPERCYRVVAAAEADGLRQAKR